LRFFECSMILRPLLNINLAASRIIWRSSFSLLLSILRAQCSCIKTLLKTSICNECSSKQTQHVCSVLCQKSEHVLSCEHTVCNTCVCIFREALSGLKYHYHIINCVLCLSETLTVQLKLLTAEYKILFINKESIWGIVSLKFMSVIQNLISECSVQDLFDKVWGTSSDTYLHVFLSFYHSWCVIRRSDCSILVSSQMRCFLLYSRVWHFNKAILHQETKEKSESAEVSFLCLQMLTFKRLLWRVHIESHTKKLLWLVEADVWHFSYHIWDQSWCNCICYIKHLFICVLQLQ